MLVELRSLKHKFSYLVLFSTVVTDYFINLIEKAHLIISKEMLFYAYFCCLTVLLKLHAANSQYGHVFPHSI